MVHILIQKIFTSLQRHLGLMVRRVSSNACDDYRAILTICQCFPVTVIGKDCGVCKNQLILTMFGLTILSVRVP